MKIKILIFFLFGFQMASAQTVKMTTEYGTKNKELYELMFFQNIGVETLSFESPDIIGKYYEINIKEYLNGKLVNTKKLFEGTSSEYFKIDSTFTSFKFFAQMENDKLKTFIKGSRFGSRKETFDLLKGKGEYVLKDFQGINNSINVSLTDEFPILAIITATIHKDGSGSYCEVAQSNLPPEKFGEKFKIPHYFIVSMKFK